MDIQPDPRLDEQYYQILSDTRPTLVDIIHALIARGESSRAVGEQVERVAGRSSVLPGLCEASARYLMRHPPRPIEADPQTNHSKGSILSGRS
ncbi:MAG: hypothetical protein AB2761_20690 [Candidatus Thiodiazotropha endolucinida]